MEARKDGNKWVLRVARGEKMIETLEQWCKEQKIVGGFWMGLGAIDWVELAHYDVDNQQYSSIEFEGPYEVTNVTGSLGTYENEIVIHGHMSLADRQMHMFGGHLVEARVSGTMEIVVWEMKEMKKQDDAETGLKLFALE